MTGLQLRGIRKAFKGVQVLDGVDLNVAQREFIAFLGPSGSGKSTLLRIIAGLETSDGGEIVLDGERIDPLPPGAVVQPVLLAYEDAARIAWVGEEHGLDNFKRILARLRPVRLTIVFLPPLADGALADRKAISAAARARVLAAMGA